MKSMVKFLIASLVLWASLAHADSISTATGLRVIENPISNGDLKLRVNKAGTRTDILTLTGATGVVSVNNGFNEPLTANATGGTINDLAWTSGIVNFVSGTVTLNGVAAQTSGTRLTIINSTGNTLTIPAEAGGSTAANRFGFSNATTLTLTNTQAVSFVYSNSRWRSVLSEATATASGTYTPTASASGNISAVGACTGLYSRTGDIVSVTARCAGIDPTSATSATQWLLTLPIASNLTATGDVSGTAAGYGNQSVSANVDADTVGDKASITYYTSADVSANVWTLSFQYKVQ